MSFSDYYYILSLLSNWISLPLNSLSAHLNFALATAFLLGVIGSASPCQLSTNVSALVFFSSRFREGWRLFGSIFTFFLGKAAIYTLLAGVAIALGLELSRLPTEVAVVLRRLLGPILVLTGVLLLGWTRLSLLLGRGWQRRLEDFVRGALPGGAVSYWV